MAADPIKFAREPYTVKYVDLAGEVKSIRRVPPPKLHDALPQDSVEITRKKNDDFRAGDSVEVVGITSRQPNVLQVRNEKGQTTFIDYFDMRLDEMGPSPSEGEKLSTSLPQDWYRDRPTTDNRYLIWP